MSDLHFHFPHLHTPWSLWWTQNTKKQKTIFGVCGGSGGGTSWLFCDVCFGALAFSTSIAGCHAVTLWCKVCTRVQAVRVRLMCVWRPRVKFRDFRHETTKPPLGVVAKSCRKLRFHVLRGLLFFSFGVNASKLACVHALCLLARSHSWRAQPCACFHELTRGSPLGHGAPIQCRLRKQIQMMFERYLGSALLIL